MADTERIGGTSALDEAVKPILQNITGGLLDMVLSFKPIEAALTDLSPNVRAAASILPVAAGYAVAKLPAKYFPNATVAHLFQDIVVEAARHVDKKIKEKGGIDNVTAGEYEQAAKDGMKAALEKKYVVDPLGHVHMPNCVSYRNVFGRQHQQRRNNKNQPQPEPQPMANEVTLKDILDQKLHAAPCCFANIEAQVSKPPEPPKARKPFRSPLEVIGAGDPELKGKFNAWYKSLTDDERKRVVVLLKHLDSVEEFMGLMAVDADIREEMLTLAENSHASIQLGHFLGILGGAVKNGASEVARVVAGSWNAYKAFDESLAPKVAELEQRLKQPRKRASWWRMFLPV
jgi:hypothetical protein